MENLAEKDAFYMGLALDAARAAGAAGEVPVGAVLVSADGAVIATAGNATIGPSNPVGHAEINVLQEAGRALGNYRLIGTTLYVTLEPCAMCAGAISHGRIARLVIGAPDPKGGAVWHGPEFFTQPTCHARPTVVEGPFAQISGQILQDFFRARR